MLGALKRDAQSGDKGMEKTEKRFLIGQKTVRVGTAAGRYFLSRFFAALSTENRSLSAVSVGWPRLKEREGGTGAQTSGVQSDYRLRWRLKKRGSKQLKMPLSFCRMKY